jgi:hypothetical protein
MNANVIRIYETGLRGLPVERIRPGDLADPYAKSPWQRVKALWSTIVDVVRETRALQAKLLQDARFTYID